jgi:23S rRNA (pseudouridine1915-N3)-methyltransferase
MKLRVVAVGKDRSGLYAPAVEEYAGRIARYVRFELLEVPEARKHAGTARGDETLALSRLTLAHRLARLVLVEQLYRALTILRGERYHKA